MNRNHSSEPIRTFQPRSSHLREKAYQGATKLYGEITPTIQARLDHELDIIARMGFEPIFLIVEDVLDFARQKDIPFSSRGSSASSLVAHYQMSLFGWIDPRVCYELLKLVNSGDEPKSLPQ